MPRKDNFEMLLEQVRWIQKNIQLVRWNPKQYSQLFGHRKVSDVLDTRQTNYMNPCFDLTSALALRLKEAGFHAPTVVVQEIIGQHTNKPAFHFALEVPIGRKIFTVDFKSGKTALVCTGRFLPQKLNPTRKNLGIRRFSARTLRRSSTMLGFFGVQNWREIGKKLATVIWLRCKQQMPQ